MKFFSTIIILFALPVLAFAAPSIEFSQTRADLGFVGGGDKVEYNFEFTNDGDEELIIHKVTSS